MYTLIENRMFWGDHLKLTSEVRNELVYWLLGLDNFKSQSMWHSPAAVKVVYSDASDTAYRGYIMEHGPYVTQGQWSPQQASRSSTWRELKAVGMVLENTGP